MNPANHPTNRDRSSSQHSQTKSSAAYQAVFTPNQIGEGGTSADRSRSASGAGGRDVTSAAAAAASSQYFQFTASATSASSIAPSAPSTRASASNPPYTKPTRQELNSRRSSNSDRSSFSPTPYATSGSVPLRTKRKLRKNTREKQRRSELNDKFDELSDLLRLGSANGGSKVEKFSVLSEAVAVIISLRKEAFDLRNEKNELRTEVLKLSAALTQHAHAAITSNGGPTGMSTAVSVAALSPKTGLPFGATLATSIPTAIPAHTVNSPLHALQFTGQAAAGLLQANHQHGGGAFPFAVTGIPSPAFAVVSPNNSMGVSNNGGSAFNFNMSNSQPTHRRPNMNQGNTSLGNASMFNSGSFGGGGQFSGGFSLPALNITQSPNGPLIKLEQQITPTHSSMHNSNNNNNNPNNNNNGPIPANDIMSVGSNSSGNRHARQLSSQNISMLGDFRANLGVMNNNNGGNNSNNMNPNNNNNAGISSGHHQRRDNNNSFGGGSGGAFFTPSQVQQQQQQQPNNMNNSNSSNNHLAPPPQHSGRRNSNNHLSAPYAAAAIAAHISNTNSSSSSQHNPHNPSSSLSSSHRNNHSSSAYNMSNMLVGNDNMVGLESSSILPPHHMNMNMGGGGVLGNMNMHPSSSMLENIGEGHTSQGANPDLFFKMMDESDFTQEEFN